MEHCNVVFASDRGYLPHLSVAIASLLCNNTELFLNIYIINTDISPIEWDALTQLDLKKEHTFINAKINDSELLDLITSYHFTKENYYRLFIADIVPSNKALYIDSDVVINGSLANLWRINITDFFLAAVEEPFFNRHKELEMNANSKYFNSGVMLINLDMWRKKSIKKKVLEFVRRKPSSIKFVDQCGLNAVIDGKWIRVSPTYNMQTGIFDMDNLARVKHYDFIDISGAVKNPCIIHYTGSLKPWHLLNNHPFKKTYWKYLSKTKYKRLFPADISIKRLIMKCLPKQFLRALNNFVNKGRSDK